MPERLQLRDWLGICWLMVNDCFLHQLFVIFFPLLPLPLLIKLYLSQPTGFLTHALQIFSPILLEGGEQTAE